MKQILLFVKCLHISSVLSESSSEPRYLDQFSVHFGSSQGIDRSDKIKRQSSSDDPEVSAVLSELLREQGERRTFPGVDFVREGASNLNDDIHAVLSDILDGVDDDYDDYQDDRDNNIIIKQLADDENRILKVLRELEAEQDRRPIR